MNLEPSVNPVGLLRTDTSARSNTRCLLHIQAIQPEFPSPYLKMKRKNKPRSVSIRHLTVALAAAVAGLSSSPLGAQAIASFNFDSDTLGTDTPAGFTRQFPTSIVGPTGGGGGSLSAAGGNGDVGVLVVGETNALGASGAALMASPGNKFLRVFDTDTGTGGTDTVNIYNTTPFTNVPLSVLSFDFSSTRYNNGTTGTSGTLALAFGNQGNPGANTQAAQNLPSLGSTINAARIHISQFTGGSSISATNINSPTSIMNSYTTLIGSTSTSGFASNTVHNLKVVVNDSESSRTYSIGSTVVTISANRYNIWLNNVLVSTEAGLQMRSNHTSGTGNFNQFAFGTISASGADWAIDNITVSAIPEPSAFAAVAGLGVLGAVALRRRRHIA